MIDLTNVFNAIIVLLTALLTAFVIPAIKNRLNDEQQEDFLKWIKIAVTAAEQIYNGSGRGKEKKEYVIAFMEEKGFIIDDESLEAAIESAVYELKESMNKKD